MKENQKNGRRMDGRETEEKIIECAGQLIAEKGFASVTSKEICRAAGVNLAAVNYHLEAVTDSILPYWKTSSSTLSGCNS